LLLSPQRCALPRLPFSFSSLLRLCIHPYAVCSLCQLQVKVLRRDQSHALAGLHRAESIAVFISPLASLSRLTAEAFGCRIQAVKDTAQHSNFLSCPSALSHGGHETLALSGNQHGFLGFSGQDPFAPVGTAHVAASLLCLAAPRGAAGLRLPRQSSQ